MCEYSILEDHITEKYIYNEKNDLWYELQGDYYVPCLEFSAEKEEMYIVVWEQRNLWYIREHKKCSMPIC